MMATIYDATKVAMAPYRVELWVCFVSNLEMSRECRAYNILSLSHLNMSLSHELPLFEADGIAEWRRHEGRQVLYLYIAQARECPLTS